MDFSEDQLLTLMQLKPDLPPRFNIPINKEPEQVPDLLDEFAHVADTKVFKEPFSLNKYKNLIPKKSQKKPRKRKTAVRSIKEKKLVFRYSTPSSPCPSVDSAIDLSADLNSNFSNNTNYSLSSSTWVSETNFEVDRASICESDFTDNSSVFSLETPSHWQIPKDNPKIIMKENRNQYLKELEDIIYIKPKKFKHTPCSLSDILLTDTSYQIPIVIENCSAQDSEGCKDLSFDNFSHNSNTLCSIEPAIHEIDKENHCNEYLDNTIFTTEKSKEDSASTINREDNIVEETSNKNKIVQKLSLEEVSTINDEQESIIDTKEKSSMEVSTSDNKNETITTNIEVEIHSENKAIQNSISSEAPDKLMIQYTAIKSSRFVVEDDCEIPPGLLELLDVEPSCSSKFNESNETNQNSDNNNNNTSKNSLKKTTNSGNQQIIKKPSSNFCVGLLHMISSGILEKSKK